MRDAALLACYTAGAQWLVVAVSLKLAHQPNPTTAFVAAIVYAFVWWRAWSWLVRDWDDPQWLCPPDAIWPLEENPTVTLDFDDWIKEAKRFKLPKYDVTGYGPGETLTLTQTEFGCLHVAGNSRSKLMARRDFIGTASSRTVVYEQGYGYVCLYTFMKPETAAAFARDFINANWGTEDVTVNKSYNKHPPFNVR